MADQVKACKHQRCPPHMCAVDFYNDFQLKTLLQLDAGTTNLEAAEITFNHENHRIAYCLGLPPKEDS